MITRAIVVVILLALMITTTSSASLEEFYPYRLPDNKQILTNDDGSSLRIDLDPPFKFYGRYYNGCHVHNNGIISFSEPPGSFIYDPFPIEHFIFVAPFFGDVDTRNAGTVWYTDPVSNDSVSLEKAREDIREAFVNNACEMFSPKYVVIATWDQVGYFKEQRDKLNTFQCVIATDGNQSYAAFLYNEIEWTTQYDPNDRNLIPTPAKVGFNDGAGNMTRSFEIPCSRTPEIVNVSMSSNVGRPGVWIFRIDGEEVVPACLSENRKTHCTEDMVCYDGQTCHTPDYDFMCIGSNRTNETCEIPTGGGNGEGSSSATVLTSVLVPVFVLLTICLIAGIPLGIFLTWKHKNRWVSHHVSRQEYAMD